MRYDTGMIDEILAQLRREPERPLILPEWCYWKNGACIVYIDQRPVRLIVHLYGMLVGPVPQGMTLTNQDVPVRNVNPYLATFVATPPPTPPKPKGPANRSKLRCRKGHRYSTRSNGTRYCPTCQNLALKQRRARLRKEKKS